MYDFIPNAIAIATQFNHANIAFTKKVDTMSLSNCITSDMHKVHHYYKLPYTDSNYGNIFSVWESSVRGHSKHFPKEESIVDTHEEKNTMN
jgi:sterol desaturase/sphingolipid hydroxylase (fatty acid hydroxylase superfamily)